MSENLDIRWHELLFGVRRSIRYHRHRQRFFDRLNKVGNILAALSGSATLAASLSSATSLLPWLAGATAVFSAADLVVGTATAARNHHDLARRFTALEQRLLETQEPDEVMWREVIQQRLAIEADEPPPLLVLNSMCHNELLRAMGYPEKDQLMIRGYQRWLAQWTDIQGHAIR